MHWIVLSFAIIFEVIGTTAMKLSDGFANLVPSIVLAVCYAISFALLTVALKYIEVSTAYAIWSGAGTALVTVVGVFYFQESLSIVKILSILLIITGVVGLNLATRTT